MKRCLIITAVLLITIISSSCGGEKKVWMDALSAAEEKEFTSGTIPEERVENLKKGISYYESDVERTVHASKQIGIYY